MQASGKTIQQLQAEADAEAEFDIQELFDDIGGAAGRRPRSGAEARPLIQPRRHRRRRSPLQAMAISFARDR